MRYPGVPVVVSSSTDTGLAEANASFPNDTVIAFPFDFSWACRRTLRSVEPRLVVLAESELWPNFLAAANRRSIPVVVVNGRLSEKSQRRSRRFAFLLRPLIWNRVAHIAMQSDSDAAALVSLGVLPDRVSVTGSVKYDGASGVADPSKVESLRTAFPIPVGAPIWVAGSTHAPEEAIVLRVFLRLKARVPMLQLILVPRHPDRFGDVAALLEAMAIPFVRRSRPSADRADVLLLDTIGELGAAWSLATVGFTGGSFDGKRQGQSMIEPAGFGVPNCFGPHVSNFRDAAKRLVAAGGAVQVPGETELEATLAEWLSDDALRSRIGAIAKTLVQQQQGATERTLAILSAWIEPVSR